MSPSDEGDVSKFAIGELGDRGRENYMIMRFLTTPQSLKFANGELDDSSPCSGSQGYTQLQSKTSRTVECGLFVLFVGETFGLPFPYQLGT